MFESEAKPIFVDRQSLEYQALAEERFQVKFFGADYPDVKWISELSLRLKSTPPDLDYTDKDYEDIAKALPILRRILNKAGFNPDRARFHGAKFNPNHVPAGEPGAGEFDFGSGGGSAPLSPSLWNSALIPQPVDQMSVSKAGVQALVQHENFSPQVYPDTAGNPTIGYGHKLLPGESFPNGITEAQGQALFQQDLNIAANAVRNNVTSDLTQPQFDALASFVFNIGGANFSKSEVLQDVNAGNFDGAANAFVNWSYIHVNGVPILSQGLINRHNAESVLFLSGIPK